MKAFGANLVLEVKPVSKKIGSLIIPHASLRKVITKREGIVKCLGESEFECEIGDSVVYDRRYEMFEEGNEVLLSQEENAIINNYGRKED